MFLDLFVLLRDFLHMLLRLFYVSSGSIPSFCRMWNYDHSVLTHTQCIKHTNIVKHLGFKFLLIYQDAAT